MEMDRIREVEIEIANAFGKHVEQILTEVLVDIHNPSTAYVHPEEIRLIALARTHIETGRMYLDKHSERTKGTE